MPRFTTPLGVEIETSEQAARTVGYQPVESSEPEKGSAKPTPKKSTRRRKAAGSTDEK